MENQNEEIMNNPQDATVVQESEEGTKTTFTSNVKSIDIPQGEAKWYILHTFSGYEQTAKANLENVVENGNLHHRILDIVIPEQEIVEEAPVEEEPIELVEEPAPEITPEEPKPAKKPKGKDKDEAGTFEQMNLFDDLD